MAMRVPHVPLWDAADLPRKGEDHARRYLRVVSKGDAVEHDAISPLAGEMPGREEGGVRRVASRFARSLS